MRPFKSALAMAAQETAREFSRRQLVLPHAYGLPHTPGDPGDPVGTGCDELKDDYLIHRELMESFKEDCAGLSEADCEAVVAQERVGACEAAAACGGLAAGECDWCRRSSVVAWTTVNCGGGSGSPASEGGGWDAENQGSPNRS